MYTVLLILFLFVCIIMTVAILLQSSKGGGLAGAFGGAASNAVFGGRGAATFLSKLTTWLAVFYLLTAFALSKMQSGQAVAGTQSIISQKQEDISSNPAFLLPQVQPSAPAAGSEGSITPAAPDTSR